MRLAEVQSLRVEFERRRVDRKCDEEQLLDTKLRREKDERKAAEELRAEQEMVDLMVATVLASDTEIADFRIELDAYDEATVKALMENEEKSEAARKDVERMLGESHVLPDGRKVFKTRDGLRVFDQKGNELSASTVTPDEVDDRKPRWEDFTDVVDRYDALKKERQDILDFQQDVDEAREQLDEGDVTKDEFADMRAKLKEKMPLAVARELPDFKEPEPGNRRDEVAASAKPASMPLPQASFASPAGP